MRCVPGHCSYVIDALAAPTVAQKPPRGQSVQALEPGFVLNVPTGQLSHNAELGSEAKAPMEQSKHNTLPLFALNLPRSHACQTTTIEQWTLSKGSSRCGRNFEASFACTWQAVPITGCRVPAGHMVHASSPRLRWKPGGHVVHSVRVIAPVWCGGHSKAWSLLTARCA